MTDPKQIPFLIKLLDEETSGVRETVFQELTSFGPVLRSEIQKVKFPLSSSQRYYLDLIFQGQKRVEFRRAWPTWSNKGGEYDKLEAALGIISNFLSPRSKHPSLTAMLNSLAFSYRVKYRSKDAKSLAYFLFNEKALEGNENDYYNPQNSNLTSVIKHGKGVPISLAVIYMLVGHRLGIDIEGCHFPGHFLARIKVNDKVAFVDCFSSGQIIEEKDIVNFREDLSEDIDHILHEKAEAETIVRRFLANLIRSYQIQEDEENCQLMIDLFKDLEYRMERQTLKNITPEDIIRRPAPIFRPGQVVYHKRYGYRGIIVDADEECQATDDWYYGNQTQPDRTQPWFHILVDGSEQVTYVAQSSIEEDDSTEEIEHPLLAYFFTLNEDSLYIRNTNQWPETDF